MERDITIYQCVFQLYAEKATVLIKFPCNFFLQWKTSNGKKTVEGKSLPTSVNSQVKFQQHLQLTTQLIFDNNSKQFLKKQSLLNLNLISKSRKDQVKLVGRVGIDLAEVANRGLFDHLKTYRLAYCSVDADITFSTVMKVKKVTNLNLQDLDKSSFNQYISFYSCHNNNQNKFKREVSREDLQQDTSIGYGRKTFENVIDTPEMEPKKSPKQFNQTFFVMPSPRQNAIFNRTGELLPKINSREKSIEAETVLSIQQLDEPIKNYSHARSNFNSRENQNWEQDRNKFRDEIDKNRFKIQELEKKILELCSNLESSKRHLEITEKENRQKEEIIKKLKNSVHIENNQKYQNYQQLECRFEKIMNEKKEQERKFRQIEQGLKRQLGQSEANILNLRRQTQEFRKMWNEKRSHLEQKIMYCQGLIREKDKKINQLNLRQQEMNKFKYQYDLMKELNDQKESKIKFVEKDLVKLSRELEEIKQNNLAQENYKLKLNHSQLLKNIEQLNQRYIKSQEQVYKFRENYIKIQTAYEIQTKNYQITKQKYSQMQNNYFNIQKENIENKNSLLHSRRQLEQIEKKNIELSIIQNKLTNDLQNSKKVNEQIKQQLKSIFQERNQLKNAIQKFQIEQQIRVSNYQKQIKRMEVTFNSSLQLKQNSYNKQKKELETSIRNIQNQLIKKENQLASKIQEKQAEIAKLNEQYILKQQQINKAISNIKVLEQSVLDKQEIIKLCKQENQSLKYQNIDLSDSLSKMKQKQKQLQENITILQEQSQKILYILELKQQTDIQLEKLRQTCKILSEEKLKFDDSIKLEIVLKESALSKNEELLKKLQEKQKQNIQKNDQLIKSIKHLQQQKRISLNFQEQLLQSKKQMSKMREIIKEINDRYEEHMKTQQRYVEEIDNIRYEKEEIQRQMNRNSNELAAHNNILQNKIQSLLEDNEKYEHLISTIEQQKRTLQNMLNESSRSEFTFKIKQQQLEKTIKNLQNKYIEIQNILAENKQKLQVSNNHQKQYLEKISTLQIKIKAEKISIQIKENQINQQKGELTQINQKYENLLKEKIQLQHRISQLQHELELVKQKIAQNIPSGAQVAQSKLIFGDQQIFSKREDQLQQLLLQSDRKNQNLQNKIQALQIQISNIASKTQTHIQESPLMYSSFTEFQREQMSKLIQQQRCQIDRLSIQIKKNANNDSSLLIKRISELQSHIQALQSSFKLQIDRMIGQQTHKDSLNSGCLMVINQQMNDDQIYRSERSLKHSASHVKSSIDVIQLMQLKQKLQTIQQEKTHLQEQFGLMEQQKFNLLSTINEKDIQIQDIRHTKQLLHMQVNEMKMINQQYLKKVKYLESQIENLKNQINFGSTLNNSPFRDSVTRSQPIIINEQQNYQESKIMEKQHLMVEIVRLKNRQQQLLWNVKDLEMQLQNVTENLNILNGSSMNSVLQSTRKIVLQDESQQSIKLYEVEQGYSKQKLLLNLKKNEQLKELAHNLIRTLKSRENSQNQRSYLYRIIQNGHQTLAGSSKNIVQVNESQIHNKINNLFNQFRLIKLQILKKDSQKEQINLTKSKDTMKDILSFEQSLKEIQFIFQQSIKNQDK